MSGLTGISAYVQNEKNWKTKVTDSENVAKTAKTDAVATAAKSAGTKKVTYTEWKPLDTSSSLVPKTKEGYGTVIGNVELSDKAKDYYNQLKSKFYNSEFILVSKDMKSQVQANAAAYGNANKMVVLIDEEKLEKMATDESFRKKYEGIIAMGEKQMAMAKGSLTSTGAAVKNFGIKVNADGSTDFFATLEKSSADQAKRIEKKTAENKAKKASEKKKTEKKAEQKRLEEKRAEKKADKVSGEKTDVKKAEDVNEEYVIMHANSIDDLVSKVSKYAYDNRANSVFAEAEQGLGFNVDFKG
ncbi:MAG: DUF6033 family protein [Lachnospiraceae bacterium]|nr:DUF6033 family protein [Lachnospiraceae bacterium]